MYYLLRPTHYILESRESELWLHRYTPTKFMKTFQCCPLKVGLTKLCKQPRLAQQSSKHFAQVLVDARAWTCSACSESSPSPAGKSKEYMMQTCVIRGLSILTQRSNKAKLSKSIYICTTFIDKRSTIMQLDSKTTQ